jgi:hypothetical protein
MLTINQCRALLKADKNKLTDEQVKQIRDFLSHLADIAIDALNTETKETELKKRSNNTK